MPFADVGPIRIESDLADEHVLFHSDIPPTGYMGAETCDIQDGDVLAVWGCRGGRLDEPVTHPAHRSVPRAAVHERAC